MGAHLVNALSSLVLLRFSRKAEYEADAYAAALLVKSGIGTGPQKALFRKLPRLVGARAAYIPDWLLSHPKTEDRIRAIEALEARWAQAVLPVE
jgi:putative metalloprotease